MYKVIILKKPAVFPVTISTDLKHGTNDKLEAELMSHIEKLSGTSMVSATHKKIANK